ncbi:hypothetical protein ACHAQH_001881 [Verticillium albo-atrum]
MLEGQAPRKANGVLPMPATPLATDAPSASRSNKSKTPVEGDKVIIRRLPPGMTEDEVWAILGDQWRAGNGLVDWSDFAKGKVSQDPAKSSRPGRLYLHIKRRESLAELDETVQTRNWEDAKLTHLNPCLIGPPSLEYCIYKKVPGARKRTDARQGTIDQDPEFMTYLLSLTNPETEKEGETGEDSNAGESKPDAKVTTTPLIEYIKEKKANRAKEAAAAKSAKHARQESQSTKNSKGNADDGKKSKKDRDGKTNKSPEKPKETVRILTKKATAEAAKAAENATSQINEAAVAAAPSEAPKSRRANIAAAARLLQRDLGLSPGSAHRRARLNAAKREAESKTLSTKDASTTVSEPTPAVSSPAVPAATSAQAAERPTTPTAPKSGRSRRGGGGKNATEAKNKGAEPATAPVASTPSKTPVVLLRKKENASASPAAAATSTKEVTPPAATAVPKAAATPTGPKASGKGSGSKKSGTTVTAGAIRGFVKHANPSQGVTEALLKSTLEAFGVVTFVEIDRRKGFAYVDFAEHESLVKAITGSPITVAQGTVQVLERKEKKPTGGGAAAAAATPAPAASTTIPAASSSSAPAEKAEHTGSRRNRRGRGGGGGNKAAASGEGGTGGQRGGGGASKGAAAGAT